MGTPTLRQWQSEALAEVELAHDRGERKVLVAACPGSGKTMLGMSLTQKYLSENKVEGGIIVSPTTNIRDTWCDDSKDNFNINSTFKADNFSIRKNKGFNIFLEDKYQVLSITYGQLIKDWELFTAMCKRKKMMLIADEIHRAGDRDGNADKNFGAAISSVAEVSAYNLALSGTPFKTDGSSIAMCPSEPTVDDWGRPCRKTLPIYTYSYGRALREGVCRPVEFIKVMGKGIVYKKSIATNVRFQELIDLNRQNKTDSISLLLDPDGDLMETMITEFLRALEEIKIHDPRAAGLITCKDIKHGNRITARIKTICRDSKNWRNYMVEEIYNDTGRASDRIKEFKTDRTDIINSVRMISEGVDIKRVRVCLHATDYMTELFFRQFDAGRPVRWEDRLPSTQFARVIIPGHIKLLEYAKKIEEMVDSALMPETGGGGQPTESNNQIIGVETEATGTGVISKWAETSERDLASAVYDRAPELKGAISEGMAVYIARSLNIAGGDSNKKPADDQQEKESRRNDSLVIAIVRELKKNGDNNEKLYSIVNGRANKCVGIPHKDKHTDTDALRKRGDYLVRWLKAIRKGELFDE